MAKKDNKTVVAKDETVKTDDTITTTKTTANAGNTGATPLAGNTGEQTSGDVKVSDSVTYHLDKDPNDPRRTATVDASELPVVDINTPGEEPVKGKTVKS